jgi:hypothetical protein
MRHNHTGKKNIQIITLLVVPLLFIIIGSMAYAAWTDELTTTATLDSADYQIEIIDCWVQHYNGLGYTLVFDQGGKEIAFADEAIFPGWNLTLITKVHNKAITISWYATINYTLYYQDETTGDWVECTATELYDLFRIKYTGGFYMDAGPDGIWCTPDDTVMDPNYQIVPCTCVYNVQTMIFDGQNHPELLGRTFNIKVVLIATYPQDLDPAAAPPPVEVP